MLVKLTRIAASSVSLVPRIAGTSIGTNGIVAVGIGVTVMWFIRRHLRECIKNEMVWTQEQESIENDGYWRKRLAV